MIFVPFAWTSRDGSGIQRVLDEDGDRNIAAMTSDGFDSGYIIGHGLMDKVRSLEDFWRLTGDTTVDLWDGDGSYEVDPEEYGIDFEEGYLYGSVEYFSEGSFRAAVNKW